MKMEPTVEQKAIAASLGAGKNVCVEAVAGSGKTTTILFALEGRDDALVVMYNRPLCDATKQRTTSRADIHTVHSAFHCVYGLSGVINDEQLEKAIQQPKSAGKTYALIVIDEMQDMTPLLMAALIHLTQDVSTPQTQFLLLGDSRQCINAYRGADAMFLQHGPLFFSSPLPWEKHTLSTSFRLTRPLAHTVTSLLQYDTPAKTLCSNRNGPAPQWILYNSQCAIDLLLNALTKEIKKALVIEKIPPNEIVLLARSIDAFVQEKPRTAHHAPTVMRILSDRLVQMGIHVHRIGDPSSCKTPQSVLMSTIHRFKGMEAKYVVMVDCFTWTHVSREQAEIHSLFQSACPEGGYDRIDNTTYVAMTRSGSHLVVFNTSFPPSISPNRFIGGEVRAYTGAPGHVLYPVTSLVKHLPFEIQQRAMDHVRVSPCDALDEVVDLPTHINHKPVAWLFGKLVHLLVDQRLLPYHSLSHCLGKTGAVTVHKILNRNRWDKEPFNMDERDPFYWQDLARLVVSFYVAQSNGREYLKSLFSSFEWFPPYRFFLLRMVDRCFERRNVSLYRKTLLFDEEPWSLIPPHKEERIPWLSSGAVRCEVPLKVDLEIGGSVAVAGAIDMLETTDKTLCIYELKTTQTIDALHYLQVALYIAMYKLTQKTNKWIYGQLLNARTGESFRVDLVGSPLQLFTLLVEFKRLGKLDQPCEPEKMRSYLQDRFRV